MNTIKVVACWVGGQPAVVDMENDLRTFQAFVGGPIEWVQFRKPAGTGVFCNEEGLINGLPLNRKVPNAGPVHGNFFACGQDTEGESRSLTDAEILAILPQLRFSNR